MTVFKYSHRRTYSLFVLFTGVACLIAVADRVGLHYDKYLAHPKAHEDFSLYVNGVFEQTLSGPIVYRVLVPYILRALQSITNVDAITIDLLVKVVLLVACQSLFYRYMRIFMPRIYAVAGVLLLDSVIAFCLSYIVGPSGAETSGILDVVIFCLALTGIYSNRFAQVCSVLFFGMLNRETPLLLLPLFFLHDRGHNRSMSRSVILFLVLMVPYAGLRLAIESSADPGWLTFYGIKYNIPFVSADHFFNSLAANIHVGILLGPWFIIGFYRFRRQPEFLRLASYVIPLYVVVHYVFGTIIEVRIWMAIFPLLLPLAVNNLRALCDDESVG